MTKNPAYYDKCIATEESIWLRKNLGFRPSSLLRHPTPAGFVLPAVNKDCTKSILDKIQDEVLWLQSYNYLTAHELQQMPRLSEQHAFHLYCYRFYRYQLDDTTNEDKFILSPYESYQEERIWLTEHSDQDWLDTNKDLQERYADHYQRYQFYHHSQQICGDEDDFFLLNNIMKRRRQDEDYQNSTTANPVLVTNESSFYESKSTFTNKKTREVEMDEYSRFKEILGRRRREEEYKTPKKNAYSTSVEQALSKRKEVGYSNENRHREENVLHPCKKDSINENSQLLAWKQRRNMQQQARRMSLSPEEKLKISEYNKAYHAKKRAKLRAYQDIVNLSKPQIASEDILPDFLLSTSVSKQSELQHPQSNIIKRQSSLGQSTMTPEEKREIRREQQRRYNQRKKEELRAVEELMIQKRKEISETPNKDSLVDKIIYNVSILAKEQEERKRLRQEAQQIQKELRQSQKRIYDEEQNAKKARSLEAKANLEEKEQYRIRAYHDVVQNFTPPKEGNPIIQYTPSYNQSSADPLMQAFKGSNSYLPLPTLERADNISIVRNQINEEMALELANSINNPAYIDLTLTYDGSKSTPVVRSLSDEIVTANPYAEISRQTLSILDGQGWLNDQIINFYMHMLLQRDRIISMQTSSNSGLPTRQQSWFGTTFFFAKLLENGQYNYNAVRRWTRRDNIDIFATDKVFFPININNTHWTLLVFFMLSKELHYYDSMNGDGLRYLQCGLRWLSDEVLDKRQITLNTNDWRCFHKEPGIPQQNNDYDCGVFVIMCARALAYNQPLTSYNQEDMPQYRLMIGRHILRESLLDSNNQSIPYMQDLNPVHQGATKNINKCTIIERLRPNIAMKASFKTCSNNVPRFTKYNDKRDESEDSDDSKETSPELHIKSEDRGDSDEDNDVNEFQKYIGSNTSKLNIITAPTSTYGKSQQRSTTIKLCDEIEKKDEWVGYNCAYDDQSLFNECKSNDCIDDNYKDARSIRLKTKAAAQKKSYWKKKEIKKYHSDGFKKGLLMLNDSELQFFADGLQHRHRFDSFSEDRKCLFCGAFYYNEETTGTGNKWKFRRCCDSGKVAIPLIQPPDEYLHNLYTGNSSEAKLFQRSTRKFNTALAFASVVSKLAEFTTKGPPVIIVQGNIQHRIGSIQKPPDKVAAYMQCYFYEESEKDNAYFKCTYQEDMLLRNLRLWIKNNNRIYGQLRHNLDEIHASSGKEKTYQIAFLDKVSAMPRTYNQPVCPEVALLTSSDLVSTFHNYKRSVIIPAQYNGRLQEIPYCSPHFYPLCYPLFHIYGEAGWHLNLKSLAPTSGNQDHERKVTLMDYCKYVLQVRDPIFRANKVNKSPKLNRDIVLCGNGLTQQYVCDLYLAIENNNLNWIRSHQKEIKAELYCDLMEAKHKHQFSLAGRYIVLPHTHVGSPRWYYGEYQDGMARCRRFHKPDLFITFTCNPNWPEIANSMKGFEAGSSSRPDLIARVFQVKLDSMMKDLQENCVFGHVLGYMYTVEWQKRGLPHAHILIFLTNECKFRTAADVDRVIRAEIPNPTTHPDLWELVTNNMIHGPCGKIKKDDKVRHCCMLKGTCEEHFPKALGGETIMTPDSYPEYRRRSKDRGGHTFYHKEYKCELDNGWVVPYNPYLLQKYGAHINVEVCTSVKAIKYLNKYVFKGSDRAQIAVTETKVIQPEVIQKSYVKNILKTEDDNTSILIDEIQQFSDCRYIGPSEACHRIFAFKLHGAKPAVTRMQVHLPDKQYVFYQEGEEEALISDPKRPPHSQLLGYFDAVKAARLPTAKPPKLKNGLSAKDLSYHEMPEHYSYEKVKGQHIWTLRKQEMEYPTIGRMYQVTPTGKNAELYHLRCLLTVRKGVGSFEELRTYNGIMFDTFKETAREMSLLKEDKEWKQCLEDYCHTMTNIEMLREKFVIIIFYNNLENPRQLWEDFKEHLCDDFRYKRNEIGQGSSESSQEDFDCALHQISDILHGQSFNKTLSDFNLPLPTKNREDLLAFQQMEQEQLQKCNNDINSEYQQYEMMCSTMNTDQNSLLKILLNELSDIKNRNTSKCYFIDAPGGTGKTYCLNAFIHYCLSKELNIIVTAYSGVAANLLLKGRTSHSQFKFPLNQDTADCTKGTLKATEALGKALYAADVIILDEGPMLHKKYWELLHNNCIDLHHRFNPHLYHTFHTPFAGKLIIGSGDLRQTLPIRRYSDRTTIVQSVMNRSYLWTHFKELHLSINERVMRNALNLPHIVRSKCKKFSEQLLQIGNGTFPMCDTTNSTVEISKIVHTSTTAETCLKDFVLWCYPELQQDFSYVSSINQNTDQISIYDKAILCALNEEVDAVNKIAVELMKGDQKQFFSADELDRSSDDYQDVPMEFLHSVSIGSLPPHVLDLKIGCPVILLRNINPRIGLCNGTKLIVHKFIGQYSIEFEIVSEGVHKGSIVPLPRIDFTTSEADFPFIMVRRQFPVRLAFAMSINKAQGQSLKRVGIYLKRPVFAHGQAYVALSRAGIPWETRLLIEPQPEGQGKVEYPGKHSDSIYITANIVYREVFSRPT